MNKVNVDLGKGTYQLRKSPKLIGVQLHDQSLNAEIPKLLSNMKLTNHWLGGFKIFNIGGGMNKLNEFLDKVRSHAAVAIGTHVYFREGGNIPMVPTGKILVTFVPNTTVKKRNQILKNLSLKLVKKKDKNLWIVSISKNSPNPMKAADLLKKTDEISHAVPFFDSPMTFHEEVDAPQDDLFLDQWYLKNVGGNTKDPKGKFVRGSDMNVPAAWKLLGNRGSTKIKLAVVDLGFDMKHPDFQGKIIAPFSLYNSERIPVQGMDTHGTACAGLAIAKSNGSGIVGVAPNAQFLPVEGTTHSTDSLEFVLKHCMDNGADIISCSWGSIEPEHELTAEHISVIANAAKKGRNGKGCVILFSVGNENAEHINHYSNHPDVIAVAASTSADEHLTVSNRGRGISVCAPGGNFALVTTRASWDEGQNVSHGFSENFKYWQDGKERGNSGLYKHFEGTSASCPLVAGVCALVLSANPKLKANEVKEIIETTADKIGGKNEYTDGYSLRFGYGRVNAEKAVAEALRRKNPSGATPPPSPPKENVMTGLFHFSVESRDKKGYGIDIGDYKSYKDVVELTEKIEREFGNSVNVNISEENGNVTFKVMIGYFSRKRKVESVLKKLKKAGYSGSITAYSELK